MIPILETTSFLRIRKPIANLISFLLLPIFISNIYAQGCLPARHIPPNMGANGISYLDSSKWEAGISYRYLHSNTFFIGTEAQHEYKERGENALLYHHSFNLFTRYGINQRLSVSLNLPIIYAKESDIHYDSLRHSQFPGTQLGDVRVMANYWLKDPSNLPNGNIAIGLGLKIPTGNSELEGTFYTLDGPQIRDYDIALQPGDGGLGVIVDLYWFKCYTNHFSTYIGANYVINPRDTNGSLAQWFEPEETYYSDSPDQFNLSTGATFSLSNFAVNLGLRFDGIPLNDLIGSSDGFRRPGNILYLDNGILWSNMGNSISISFPYAIHRNIITSNFDRESGEETLGGLADFLTLVSYTHRFD